MTRILLIDQDLIESNQISRFFTTGHEEVGISHLSTYAAVRDYLDARGPGQSPRMDAPSLIILDVDFPNAMEGLDLLDRLNKVKQFADIPKFIFTKNTDKAIVANCYVRGANGYFLKPPENVNFSNAVRMLTERWRHIIQKGFGYNYKAV